MKKTLLLLWIALFSISIYANPIDGKTALKIANNFYTIQLKKASANFTLAYECTSQARSTNKNVQIDKKTYYYVFNNADQGFIIISGDDATYPVLGYSDSGSFDIKERADNFTKWMENYKKQIRYVMENNIQATAEIKLQWKKILDGTVLEAKSTKTVSPLVTAQWSQSPYENADCPADADAGSYNGYHAVSGCPATAMAQIMNYWEYPTQGKGFHSYNHDKYGTLSANFASTTYDWASMPDNLTSANSAVAELMYHCGVAVEMNYGPHSSGSYVILDYTASPEQCSEYAYKTYFDYDITIGGKMRENYTDSEWKQLLKNDLDAKQPIQYAGFGQGGHTFVCDGYNASDYFHFNWGWGGTHDGYFLIDDLAPGAGETGAGAGSYNDGQQAIFGLKPADGSTPGGGGTSTASFDLRLYSDIVATPEAISYGQSFSVTTAIKNFGDEGFTGDLTAALFDGDYNFVEFVGSYTNQTIGSLEAYNIPFNFTGSLTILPGDYYIGYFYKEAGEDWAMVDKGEYSQLAPFSVQNPADIELYADMEVNPTIITQTDPFSVSLNIVNDGTTDFTGSLSVDLYNMDGTWATVVEELYNFDLPPNSTYQNSFTFSTSGVNIAPGTYLLALMYDENATNDWVLAGSSYYTNPIKITVKAPPIAADGYENNNTENEAYPLSANFAKSSASILTTGSNMHYGEDIDYYKIDLPTGYNYTISARTHDSYNSGNGQTYTNDVSWMYIYDGMKSDVYDDAEASPFSITNGGSVIFSVSSYFVGSIGDYLLDIQIVNDGITTSVEEIDFAEMIKIYPVPAKDFLTVDVSNFPAKVNKLNFVSLSGKKIKADFNTNEKLIKLPVNTLSNGVFILSIETENGTIQKKVLINK